MKKRGGGKIVMLVKNLCFFPEPVTVNETDNSIILTTHLPYVKICVRKENNKYAIKYEALVFELYPGIHEVSWEWFKKFFPIYAELCFYKGYNTYIIEINSLPSRCENLRWNDFLVVTGGKPIAGKNVVALGLNQGDSFSFRYVVAFFLPNGELTVEKAKKTEKTIIYTIEKFKVD